MDPAVRQTSRPIEVLRGSGIASTACCQNLVAVVSAGVSAGTRGSTINTGKGGVLAVGGRVRLGGNGGMVEAALDSVATRSAKWGSLVQPTAARKAVIAARVDTTRVSGGANTHVDVTISFTNSSTNTISTVLSGVWAVDGSRGTALRGDHQVVGTALDAVSRCLCDIKLPAGAGSGTLGSGDGCDERAHGHAASVVRIGLRGGAVAEAV